MHSYMHTRAAMHIHTRRVLGLQPATTVARLVRAPAPFTARTHTHTHTATSRREVDSHTQPHTHTYSMATYCLLPTPSVPPLPATPPPSPASASPPLCLSAPDRRRDRLPWRLLEPRLDRWPPLLAPSPSQVLGVALKPMAAAALASPPLPWWWRRRDPPRDEGRDRCLAPHVVQNSNRSSDNTAIAHAPQQHRTSTRNSVAPVVGRGCGGCVCAGEAEGVAEIVHG